VPDLNPLDLGDCAFCDPEATASTRLHEGQNFYIVADHAPVAEAHLLLIPRQHLPHLAALPSHLDAEFEQLKALMGGYVGQHHAVATYWENGVFGQSVPHAHLHAISITVDRSLYTHAGNSFEGIDGLRRQHAARGGQYFTIEQAGEALFLPPDPELYGRIIRDTRARNGGNWRHDREGRRLHGLPLIEAMKLRWAEFGLEGGRQHLSASQAD
jgi:diadenosine tetraphosphate (Ap4A) HIT family hydrolase